MIDNKTIRKVIMLNKMLPGGSPTYENREASGAVANFTTNTVQPFVKCECEILPIQEGTGDPSPSNVQPISGTSVLNVEQRGKNLIKEEISIKNRYILANGITAYNGTWGIVNVNIKGGANYTISGINYPDTGTYFAWYDENLSLVSVIGTHKNYTGITAPNNAKILGMSFLMTPNDARYDLNTAQVEVGSTATTYEAYKSETYTVNLGQTVYGGSVDIIAGTGKVLDEHSELIDITFTPESISALEGVNNVWCDTGETKVTYKYKTGEGGSSNKKYLPIFYDFTERRSTNDHS